MWRSKTALVLVAMAAVAGTAPAGGRPKEVELRFGPPEFKTVSGSTPWIYQKGEYYSQSFPRTGLASADRLTLVLAYMQGLSGGAQVDLDVILNGVKVGAISIKDGQPSPQKFRLEFKAVKGPDFTIQLLETNTVPPGLGSIAMTGDGKSSHVTLWLSKPPVVARVAVPDKADLDKADGVLKKLFREDLEAARKDAARGKALAGVLVKEAQETTDDSALRYVALALARDVAVDIGDPELAMAAAGELARLYQLKDGAGMQAAALIDASAKVAGKEASQFLFDTAFTLIDEAVAADNFAAARKLADAAERGAQAMRSLPLQARVERRRQEIAHVEKEFARVKPFIEKLEKNPDDAEANGEVGRYMCLGKGVWDKGLPLLAKSDDATLKPLALRDLATPKDAKTQVELADAWLKVAEGLKGPATPVKGRAYYWYCEALPLLEAGLTRMRVQRQVEELFKLFPGNPPPKVP